MRKTAFLDLAEKRRSVRAYKPDEVPEELLRSVDVNDLDAQIARKGLHHLFCFI